MRTRLFGAFATFMAMLMPVAAVAKPCTLLVVGDSLSAGYGLTQGQGWVDLLNTRLQAKHPQWHAVNASISGDTTQNGLQRLPAALERHHPQGVLIELGANDVLRGTPPATIERNLTALVRQAQAQKAWVVLVDAPVLPNYGQAYMNAVTKVYLDVSRAENVPRIPCFLCRVATRPEWMQADGLHPNAKAQAEMLNTVWPHLQPQLRCR